MSRVGELTELVGQVQELARAHGRDDLNARLDATARRLAEPGVRVLVVGEFKQGKSLLVNALVRSPVCAVDDDVATAVPTVVRHGPPSSTLIYGAQDGDAAPERRPVALDELRRGVAERDLAADADRGRRLVSAEVTVPAQVLEKGLVLVDTPGVGGFGSVHAANTMAELPTADAVLLVSDAAQEFTEPELEFLRLALRLCPNVACVLTKTDLYPHWSRIAELDRVHLSGAGIEAPLMAVSSTLRLRALETTDQALNAESGFPALTRHLQRDVVGRADELARRSVAHDVEYACEHLALSLTAEQAVLRDPAHQQEHLAQLEAAKARADELRRRSSRWQQALNDGMVDLQADIEYDVRDRTRLIVREAEEIIDAGDPATMAEQFDTWFEQRVAAAVADNFVWAHERGEWLASQVAEHFAEAGGASLPELRPADAAAVLEPVPSMPTPTIESVSFGGKLLIGMRGSYGGVLMFGLLTGIAGMALLNPISLGAGAILGRRAYAEDKENKLRKRRSETKLVVRRQIDDVVLHVTKQAKDRLREIQRLLRDHFTQEAEELQRSLSESITAAQRASTASAKDRDARLQEVKASLLVIENLRKRAGSLTGPARRSAA